MSEEMEWQPVRIAPYIPVHSIDPALKWKENQGKIIRVRFYRKTHPQAKFGKCRAKLFCEVHPDDAVKVSDYKSLAVCEHMIQAD